MHVWPATLVGFSHWSGFEKLLDYLWVFYDIVPWCQLYSCNCISKPSHQRQTSLSLPLQLMVQLLLVPHQGLCPHHLKLLLHLLLHHRDSHQVQQLLILQEDHRLLCLEPCHHLHLQWEMGLGLCPQVELYPFLRLLLAVAQWRISLQGLRWLGLPQWCLHKVFQDSRCRVREFAHLCSLLTWGNRFPDPNDASTRLSRITDVGPGSSPSYATS